jgi:hypothetical protein
MNLEQFNRLTKIVEGLPEHSPSVDYHMMMSAGAALECDLVELHEAWVRLRRDAVQHGEENTIDIDSPTLGP